MHTFNFEQAVEALQGNAKQKDKLLQLRHIFKAARGGRSGVCRAEYVAVDCIVGCTSKVRHDRFAANMAIQALCMPSVNVEANTRVLDAVAARHAQIRLDVHFDNLGALNQFESRIVHRIALVSQLHEFVEKVADGRLDAMVALLVR